jgi:hypothetical protein
MNEYEDEDDELSNLMVGATSSANVRPYSMNEYEDEDEYDELPDLMVGATSSANVRPYGMSEYEDEDEYDELPAWMDEDPDDIRWDEPFMPGYEEDCPYEGEGILNHIRVCGWDEDLFFVDTCDSTEQVLLSHGPVPYAAALEYKRRMEE